MKERDGKKKRFRWDSNPWTLDHLAYALPLFYCYFLNVFLHLPNFLNIGVIFEKHFTFNQEQRSSAFTSITFVRPFQPTIFFISDQKMFLRLASIQCFPRWAFPSNKSKRESKKWKIWKDQTKEEKDWDGLDSFFFKPASFHFPKIFFSYFCAIDEISSLLFLGQAYGSAVSKVAHGQVV